MEIREKRGLEPGGMEICKKGVRTGRNGDPSIKSAFVDQRFTIEPAQLRVMIKPTATMPFGQPMINDIHDMARLTGLHCTNLPA